MITLTTDRRATQLVQNVDDLFSAIKKYYSVRYSDPAGHCLCFGHYPIKEHGIRYSPYFGGEASLSLSRIDDKLIVSVFGYRAHQLYNQAELIRKAEGNEVANQFELSLQPKSSAFFGTDAVAFKIDVDESISAKVNIETLDHAVLDSINTLLQHTSLIPRAQDSISYDLSSDKKGVSHGC